MREVDDELRQIVRRIGRIETVITRQGALISKLDFRGQDSTRATELLAEFKGIRASYFAERDEILQLRLVPSIKPDQHQDRDSIARRRT